MKTSIDLAQEARHEQRAAFRRQLRSALVAKERTSAALKLAQSYDADARILILKLKANERKAILDHKLLIRQLKDQM